MMKKIVMLVLATTLTANMNITAMAGQWQKDTIGWHHEDNGTYSTNQWKEIDGKQYYFDGNGYMLHDMITLNGYKVGSDGAWIPSTEKILGSELYEYCGTYFYNGYMDMYETHYWEPDMNLQVIISFENDNLYLTTADGKKYELKKKNEPGNFISEQYGDSVWDAYRVEFKDGKLYFSTEENLIEYINCNSVNYASEYLDSVNHNYSYSSYNAENDILYLFELRVEEKNGVLSAYIGGWEGEGARPSFEDFNFILENGKIHYNDVIGLRSKELYDITLILTPNLAKIKVLNKKTGELFVEGDFKIN